MIWEHRCPRCDRVLGSRRRYQAHLRRPCDQDTPQGRRQSRSGVPSLASPMRPRPGRKLMMRPVDG
jgi:hypothetical protein